MNNVISVKHVRRYMSRDGAACHPPPPDVGGPGITRLVGMRMWRGHLKVLCVRGPDMEEEAVWEDILALGHDPHLLCEFRKRWLAWAPSVATEDASPILIPPALVESALLAESVIRDPTTAIVDPAGVLPPRRSGRARRQSRRAMGVS